jgi:hypothetical protein
MGAWPPGTTTVDMPAIFGVAKTNIDAIVQLTNRQITASFTTRQAPFVYDRWLPFLDAWNAFLHEGYSTQALGDLEYLAKHYVQLRREAVVSWGFAISTPPSAMLDAVVRA